MATMNPFDLLGDGDAEDPTVLASQAPQQERPKKEDEVKVQVQAKLPSKPAPPAQAAREARNESGRGVGRGRGFERGRGRGFNREVNGNDNSNDFSGGYRPSDEVEAGKSFERRGFGGPPRGSSRGGLRGGFGNGEVVDGERSRRPYERRSGTGRGNDFKREGAGRGNWGTATEEVLPETGDVGDEKNISPEKPSESEDVVDASKEAPVTAPEVKEPEDKEMTLEEYEKILEEKRKALLALRTEERKVDADKEFGSMQPLSNKKSNDEIFIKLGSEKDKRKDAVDKDEKAKKSVSINEFLKPAEGERYYGGRNRGRGRGPRGGGNARNFDVAAPSIEDPGQFPSLGGK